MKILFTICARKGSKGLKNKNISEFLDFPICYYTLSAYKLFKNTYNMYDCELAINTDSDELVEQAKSYGENFKHIVRTEALAGDKVGKIDVIRDTYLKMGGNYDIVMDLDLTSPLRTTEDIYGVLERLLNTPGADLSFSMTSSRRSPYFNQVKKCTDGYYKPVNNTGAITRQEVPVVYDMNASIYAFRPEFLQRNAKLFDGNAVGYEMKDTAVLDIDNPEDKELMEILAKYFYNTYPKFREIRDAVENCPNSLRI